MFRSMCQIWTLGWNILVFVEACGLFGIFWKWLYKAVFMKLNKNLGYTKLLVSKHIFLFNFH